MHNCTTFWWASRLFTFFLSARTGSTCQHNTLSNKIISDCASWNIDGLMHSVFAGSLTVCQVRDSVTPIHTIHYHKNAEVYSVLLHCWDVPNLKTLLRHILSYYNAELFSILKHCWSIYCPFTLLNCSQSYKIAETYLDLLRSVKADRNVLRWTMVRQCTNIVYSSAM